ncbi:MAG: DUF932 domain-containing protein [Planctomycetaceae bacterium]|nr:DUF932 domain-containing protein [Planctomycetaceae bacterium]
MTNLTRAHRELYRRSPDERFASLSDLVRHCRVQKAASQDRWELPQYLVPNPRDDNMALKVGTDGEFLMNDWSFSQLCGLAGVSKETVNRVLPETATSIFHDTLPTGSKPLQILTSGDVVRSIHGASYTRLWNTQLLEVVQEFATDFQAPQKAAGGGTGLYAGEQDLFCFLIDPNGWAEIEGEAFAPGFFVWNSEVGKRSVGISTFWFQAVCANHIVWDAVEVVEFSRKHTANVHEALLQIRRTLEQLVEKRDKRRDGFVRVLRQAMQTRLGSDAEEVQKVLAKSGISRTLAARALEIAEQRGAFTIFAVVDALTRLAGELQNAGERLEADQKAVGLLDLVAAGTQ